MLSHIVTGFTTSFLGSLPLGIISLTVLEITINRKPLNGIFASIGVGSIEFFQALIAVTFLSLFVQYPFLKDAINIISVPIFIFFAYSHLSSTGAVKRQIPQAEDELMPNAGEKAYPKRMPWIKRNSFVYGAFISSLNVVVYPFWIIVGGNLIDKGMLINENDYIFAFAFGVGIGTISGMLVYVLVGMFLQKQLQQYNLWMNRVVGVLFAGLALMQTYSVIMKFVS